MTQSLQSPVKISPNSIPLIPLELWYHVFLILLHGAVEEREVGIPYQSWCGRAFTSLWLTCRALHTVGEQVRRRLHLLADGSLPKGSLDLKRLSELQNNEPKPEIIMLGMCAGEIVPVVGLVIGLKRLELANMELYPSFLQRVIDKGTIRCLNIRSCRTVKLLRKSPSTLQYPELDKSMKLHRSKIARLELDYTTWSSTYIPREAVFLTFIPTLRTLTLCGKSLKAVVQLPQTRSLPPLQHLIITDSQLASVTKADAIKLLGRCPTLETLNFEIALAASPLDWHDVSATMPDLEQYEGPAKLLALLQCPNLRHAVAKQYKWDSGTSIQTLAATSPVLHSLVVELTTRAEDPVCGDIMTWVEQAASRYNAHLCSTTRFSLVLRAAPLGEWIVSAKVGRMDDGCFFIEHVRQRDLVSVNKTTEE